MGSMSDWRDFHNTGGGQPRLSAASKATLRAIRATATKQHAPVRAN